MAEKLMGYCMKTKQKEEFAEAEITKTAKGGFMAKGKTKNGFSMCAMLSEANALQAIKDKVAKQGF